MSEQGLSPQRREVANDQKKLYEQGEGLSEDQLEPISESRAVTEATEKAVRTTIERACTMGTHLSSLNALLEVEGEEDVLEMISSMIIADAAALAAAQAAAFAETTSLRVRDARPRMLKAEQRLGNTKAAILKQKL